MRTTEPDRMQQKVRIYYPSYKNPLERNYFKCMTGIGPAFGASLEDTPVMTREEALRVVGRFPLVCDWEFETLEEK